MASARRARRRREGGQADDDAALGRALSQELTQVMSDVSICGLGQAAMNPVTQVLKHFREDLT